MPLTPSHWRVAWSRVNPATVSLLQRWWFLERASKQMEEEKTLTKMTGSRPPPQKRQCTEQQPNDLRCFLDQDVPAKYGTAGTPGAAGRTLISSTQTSNTARRAQGASARSSTANSYADLCRFRILLPYYAIILPPICHTASRTGGL